ncbi:hypothetical protein BDY17DRAFT_95235 [Neohortaea acidophila]|uniref:Fungal-specific transcription factor domain-containing protein n=1 Tax=Neohortaea acidophila TaxID=245834 RepID=A0A6A6PY28_9PEZI|nr:uncharacterized protein BDY17DRAFT_95235 [Neohortaea acidophila]KAF2485020.1 hypothetical protein BDY17DRAFT_95235 [Neohortaea acidophila]
MFTCEQCHKAFKTRTSLTRHAHNHTHGRLPHTCNICQVAFARRDVLRRHLRTSHAVGETARKRCHTACEACRAARIKCDGNVPCHDCSIHGRQCRSASARGRVSQAVPQDQRLGADTSPPGDAGADDTPWSSEASPNNVFAAANLDFAEPPNHQHVENCALESTMPGSSYLPLPSGEIAGFETTAWPWLHENLYLQDEPLFDQILNNVAPIRMSTGPPADSGPVYNHSSVLPFTVEEADIPQRPKDTLTSIVEDLVAYAASVSSVSTSPEDRCNAWTTAAHRLEKLRSDYTASTDPTRPATHHLLNGFVSIHMAQFNPLWPLFSQDGFNADNLHPVCYLTLTSIGAMYGSLEDRRYGTLMHERLRRLLCAALFDLESGQDDLVWLSHARLLTQVAALYFGQKQAFSYAQHLGAILVAQARRMNLFARTKHPAATSRPHAPAAAAERSSWSSAEQQRRLAFGILRADVFTSTLLNTRPYLTYEEFRITLPRSDSLWHNDKCLTVEQLLVAQQFEDEQHPLNFADLVHIALERDEDLPQLTAAGYELCLFGLQGLVWSFSQDTDVLHQMKEHMASSGEFDECSASATRDAVAHPKTAGEYSPPSNTISNSRSLMTSSYSDNGPDALAVTPRRMSNLQSGYARLVDALHRWHRDMRRARPDARRDSRMSGMLLYHISHLQLFTSLQDLHHISYACMEERPADHTILTKVQRWVVSKQASLARSHAWSIWSIVRDEHRREIHQRSRFNFLAFCGLHHAAVVIWTMHAGRNGDPSHENLADHLDVRQWLSECAAMFDALSPLGGASFGAAARKLARRPFPVCSNVASGLTARVP